MKVLPVVLILFVCLGCKNEIPMETSGGWVKYSQNPVLGGKFGTIFDIAVIQKNDSLIQLFSSWRPQRSIALSESKDGFRWTDPQICLPYNDSSGWVLMRKTFDGAWSAVARRGVIFP